MRLRGIPFNRLEYHDMESTSAIPTRIITQKELASRVPYSASQIRRLEKSGAFPRRIQLGPNRVGWNEEEIEAWLRQRLDERGAS
jgi:prophage regulatory protein